MRPAAGAAPDADRPNAAAAVEALQQAVERWIALHAEGRAPSIDDYVRAAPGSLQPQLLARLREFLAFDGLLGHQEWEPTPTETANSRSIGDFVIEAELGRGGMGVVYLAQQRSLQRRVALKVMASGLTLSKRHVERFRREAAATAQLRHPAIVPVHSLLELDGTFALAMDYIAGRNLADLLDDLRLANGDSPAAIDGKLGLGDGKGYVADCALLCAELASALAAAHAAGIVHRDLKPRNVMIDDQRQVRLLDFGLAKSPGDGSLSLSGEITGTAHYLSPEQTLAKRVAIDHRTDIWSLGVMLYELLTLRRPFDGKNLQQIVYAICFQEPTPPGRLNPKVPRDLAVICGKAMEKDPQRRYQSAAELEADLRRFLRWEPIQARPAGPLARAGKWLRRHRTESALVGSMLALGLVLAGYNWWQRSQDRWQAGQELARAEAAAMAGQHNLAIEAALAALRLQDDPAIVERVARYRALAEMAATKTERDTAESRRLCLASAQAKRSNRQQAMQLALAAIELRADAESRSALLAALGGGQVEADYTFPDGQTFMARSSPAGDLVVAVGNSTNGDNAALWRADGSLLAMLRGHRGQVLDAAFVPFADLVATAGVDGSLRLWSCRDGTAVGQLAHDRVVHLVRTSADGRRVLTASYGREGPYGAQVWDLASRRRLGAVGDHQRLLLAAELAPDGSLVASSGDAGFVRLWEAASGVELARLPGQPERPRALAFAPDSKLLAVAGADGELLVYSLPDGDLLGRAAHSRQVDAIAFSHDGKRLLTGARDQTVRVWQLEPQATGIRLREQQTLLGHDGEITGVAFDASDKLAVTSCIDGVVRIFDVGGGRSARSIELSRHELGTRLEEAGFLGSSDQVLVQVGNQRAVVWRPGAGQGIATLRQPGAVPAAAWTPDGQQLVTAGDDERLRIWRASDGSLGWTSPAQGLPLRLLEVDPTGNHVLASRSDGRLQLHRLRDGELLHSFGSHQNRLVALRHSRDGRQALSAGLDGRAVLWRLADRTEQLRIERPQALVAADLAPDGTLIATVERGEQVVRLWSASDGSSAGSLSGHSAAIRSVRFHPDGQSLLSAAADGEMRISSLAGQLLRQIQTGQSLSQACWDRDGALIITNGPAERHVARVWSSTDGNEWLRFSGHEQAIDWIASNPSGPWLATAARDGTTKIWPTDPEPVARRQLLQLPPNSTK